MGVPSTYTPEMAEEICDKIASCSKGLKKLCRENKHWPTYDTIYKWLRKHEYFTDLYVKAKKDQVRALVEEILDISDDTSNDDKENDNGTIVCNSEWVARSRLRVDTRKWIAAKLVPRLYGDNMLGRELADEIEELKTLLKMKSNERKLENVEANSGEEKEDSEV